MKTAIAIDSLLNRDEATFIVELILNLFPDSELYTIAHKQGGILGTIETRSIVSSFLTHKIDKGDVFKKNFWILPSAVKAIPLHPTITKVIIISRGYIHGLNVPRHVERLLYVLDWDLVDQSSLGWQGLFKSYVNQWREKAFLNFHKIAVSSEALKERLELPNAEVIQPTYRTEEYPFVKDEDHNFLFTHHLLYTQGLTSADFKLVAQTLIGKGEMVRVLGPDSHLESVKKDLPQLEFGGDHCEATNALYSHQAKAIWDFSSGHFPARAFGALATGRPVIVRDTNINREYLTHGTYFVQNLNPGHVEKLWSEVEGSYLSVDRRALRRLGLKWNERLFKSRMVKFLERHKDLA
jgi:hypothetical protein